MRHVVGIDGASTTPFRSSWNTLAQSPLNCRPQAMENNYDRMMGICNEVKGGDLFLAQTNIENKRDCLLCDCTKGVWKSIIHLNWNLGYG